MTEIERALTESLKSVESEMNGWYSQLQQQVTGLLMLMDEQNNRLNSLTEQLSIFKDLQQHVMKQNERLESLTEQLSRLEKSLKS